MKKLFIILLITLAILILTGCGSDSPDVDMSDTYYEMTEEQIDEILNEIKEYFEALELRVEELETIREQNEIDQDDIMKCKSYPTEIVCDTVNEDLWRLVVIYDVTDYDTLTLRIVTGRNRLRTYTLDYSNCGITEDTYHLSLKDLEDNLILERDDFEEIFSNMNQLYNVMCIE